MRLILLFAASLALVACSSKPGSTDGSREEAPIDIVRADGGSYWGMLRDRETGCEYLARVDGGITPRMSAPDDNGAQRQICRKR